MPKLRHGHAAGHVRETAIDAFRAWIDWDDTSPEPTIDYEIDYEPHRIPISQACGLVWNCTDIVPGGIYDDLEDVGLTLNSRTYGACAQAILGRIKLAVAA
jgi:hypothetical protein